MAHELIRGFVLREVPVGEADRLIEILTAERGLVTAYARGARRSKSPLIASTQIFSLSDFSLFAYKGRLSVDQADLIEPFMGLRNDLDRLISAAHLAEVFHDLVRDDLTGREIYTLWAYACNALQNQADPFLVAHVAQFKALTISGFAPDLSCCQICGQKADQSSWFDFNTRCLYCPSDRPQSSDMNTQQLSHAAILCLQYCLVSTVEKLFAFRLDSECRDEICRFSNQFLEMTMEKHYQKLDMLRSL